jgi:hypothetical protein
VVLVVVDVVVGLGGEDDEQAAATTPRAKMMLAIESERRFSISDLRFAGLAWNYRPTVTPFHPETLKRSMQQGVTEPVSCLQACEGRPGQAMRKLDRG